MRDRVRAFAAAFLLAAAPPAGVARAAGFVALALPQRRAAAQEAVAGTVVDVDVVVRDGEPWTLVTLRVDRWWRHAGENVAPGPSVEAIGETLTAAFWGGRAPGAPALQVAGVPTFAAGERVVWLLRSRDDGLAAPTVGVSQGVWRSLSGAWVGDDGRTLGLDEDGRLALDGAPAPDAVLFDAIAAAFADLVAP